MSKFATYLTRGQRKYGERFNPSTLAKKFIQYYESGERIKVCTCEETLTGTVGVTTGWRPSFLLMRRRSDYGSSWLLGEKDSILAVKRGRKYQSVAVG
jgi:hypothetical protein